MLPERFSALFANVPDVDLTGGWPTPEVIPTVLDEFNSATQGGEYNAWKVSFLTRSPDVPSMNSVVSSPLTSFHVFVVEMPSTLDQNYEVLAEFGFEVGEKAKTVLGGQVLHGPAVEASSLVGDRTEDLHDPLMGDLDGRSVCHDNSACRISRRMCCSEYATAHSVAGGDGPILEITLSARSRLLEVSLGARPRVPPARGRRVCQGIRIGPRRTALHRAGGI